MIVLTVKKWVLAVSVVAYVVIVAIVVTLLLVFDKHGSSRGSITCQCPNGTPATTCSNPNESRCAKCDVGYHLDENQLCSPNICFCPGGTPATGTACTKDQATICSSCKEGYKMVDQTCQLICTCKNGIPKDSCDYPETCATCNTGYHLDQDNNTCVQNTCKCVDSDNNPAGTPATGTKCIEDKGNMCSKCNDGYDMQSDKTCKSKCVDLPGQTWTNWPTHLNNPSGCSLCPHHHYVSTTSGLPDKPPTLSQVAQNPSKYQYMCASFDKMLVKDQAFKIVPQTQVHTCSGQCVRSFTGENSDVGGWDSTNTCWPGMCYYRDNDTNKDYCMYPCYSQSNS